MPTINITVTWIEDGEEISRKAEAFGFESASESLGKLERAYQQRVSDRAFVKSNEDDF